MSETFYEKRADCILLNIRVVPRASKDAIQGVLGDVLKVRIQAPPVEGKANAYLIRFLAKKWNISRSSIEILAGESGRNKRLCIHTPCHELCETLASIPPA